MRLIDADALIQKRWQVKQVINQPDIYVIGQGYIMDAPTIDPTRRGRWIQGVKHEFGGEDWDEVYYIDCNQCGHREWHYDIESGTCKAPNYCQNCGAKMS